MTGPDGLDRALINAYQGGFPLVEQPFAPIAKRFSIEPEALISHVRDMLDEGWLTRFGPLYNAERFGGSLTLAALQVPEADYSRIADIVNALPTVAHNYRRDHPLNMWFVIATEDPESMKQAISEIEQQTGLEVFNFPKLREFYLGLWFEMADDGVLRTRSIPATGNTSSAISALDDIDRRIIIATQEGLPLVERPYAQISQQVGISEQALLQRMEAMLSAGVIRRIGLVPNHYKLGFRGNGMSVWDIPDDRVNELGERVAALDFVSHCYIRPRHLPLWPYNLFAMVHGRDRDSAREKTEEIAALLGGDCRQHDILFSSAVLKKTGLRLAA